MRKSLALSLFLVIGILIFSPMASAGMFGDILETLGLGRISGAPTAFNVGNTINLDVTIKKPVEQENFYSGEKIEFLANVQKSGFPYSDMQYVLYVDGEIKKGPQNMSAKKNKFTIKNDFAPFSFSEGEHEMTLELCGMDRKLGCVGLTSSSVNFNVVSTEGGTASSPSEISEDERNWQSYTLYEGNSITLDGTKVTVKSISDKQITLITERVDSMSLKGETKTIPKYPLKIKVMNVDSEVSAGLKRSVTLNIKKA